MTDPTSPGSQRDWNALSDDEFRQEAASFFAQQVPAHLKFLSRRPRWAEVRD